MPLAGRALASGAILTWTRALGEFGATILFAGNLEGVTQTMPMAIYLGFERNLGVALALSVVLILVSGILLAITKKLDQQERLTPRCLNRSGEDSRSQPGNCSNRRLMMVRVRS